MPLFGEKKTDRSEYTFSQAPNFRGFRKVMLTTRYTEGLQKNIIKLATKNKDRKKDPHAPQYLFDMSGAKITLKLTSEKNNKYSDASPCVHVLVNGLHIGTRYRNEYDDLSLYDLLKAEKIEAVYIMFRPYIETEKANFYDLSAKGECRHDVFIYVKVKEYPPFWL